MKQLSLYAAIVAIAVAVDQWIKYLVETRLVMHEMVEVIPFLALYRTYNTGVAFSMFAESGDWRLIAVVIAVTLFIVWLAVRSAPHQVWARTGFALIVGGALGNLIDRALLGHVVDYLYFHTPWWSFAVFNLADAAITVGAGLVILQEVLDWLRERARSKAD